MKYLFIYPEWGGYECGTFDVIHAIEHEDREKLKIELFLLATERKKIADEYYDKKAVLLENCQKHSPNHRLYIANFEIYRNFLNSHKPENYYLEIVYQEKITIPLSVILNEEYTIMTLEEYWESKKP